MNEFLNSNEQFSEWKMPKTKSKTPENSTHENMQDYLRQFEEKGIVNFETNLLDVKHKQQLLNLIDNKLDSDANNNEAKALYKELRGFIDKNNKIFSEFSHGTSSIVIDKIISAGIYPKEIAYDLYHKNEGINVGEGNRGARNTEKIWTISAGVGQGGLGTAMAYAEINNNKDWNVDLQTVDELKNELKKYDLVKKKSLFDQEKIEILQNAISNKEKGIFRDNYPIIVGFDRSKNIIKPSEGQFRAAGNKVYNQGKNRNEFDLAADHEFDSEITLGSDDNIDQVFSRDISTIACPKEKVEQVRQLVKTEAANKDIDVISLEALKLLSDLGFNRIEKAKNATSHRIKDNLNLEQLSLILGRNS